MTYLETKIVDIVTVQNHLEDSHYIFVACVSESINNSLVKKLYFLKGLVNGKINKADFSFDKEWRFQRDKRGQRVACSRQYNSSL